MAEAPQQLPTYAWIWNSQAPPPASGQVRTDSRDWVGALQLNIDRRTDTGTDVSADLASLKVGDAIRLEHHTDPTRYAYYGLTSAVRIVDYFQYGATYKNGSGVIPNSGTRVLLTATINPPSQQALYWLIEPAREPNRYWIVCYCAHGELVEAAATYGGPPLASPIVQTTASNLLRRTVCNCNQLTPPVT